MAEVRASEPALRSRAAAEALTGSRSRASFRVRARLKCAAAETLTGSRSRAGFRVRARLKRTAAETLTGSRSRAGFRVRARLKCATAETLTGSAAAIHAAAFTSDAGLTFRSCGVRSTETAPAGPHIEPSLRRSAESALRTSCAGSHARAKTALRTGTEAALRSRAGAKAAEATLDRKSVV